MEAEQPLLEKRRWEQEEVEDEDHVALRGRQHRKPDLDANVVLDASPVSTNDSKPAADHGGTESTNGVSEIQSNRIHIAGSSNWCGKNMGSENVSGLIPSPAEKLFETPEAGSKDFDHRADVDEDIDLIEEIEEEFTGLDVEGVLKKQNTHDLYCPNCNSCITRRVILIRRQRKPERDAQGPENVSTNTSATPAPDEEGNDGEREAFRCLSCLCFFCPPAPSPPKDDPIHQYVPSQSPDNMPASPTNDPLGAPIDGRTPAHPGKPTDPPLGGISDDAMVGENAGEDLIVVVGATTDIGSIAVSPETGFSESRGLDILKSIVYGGLVESITSLGVVSSAAGAGASTLNVLAMGLANLMGGLFVIVHNLRELKKEQSSGVSSETNKQEDRYQELLGQRDNFPLHATVAILSYLIFGLIPPIVYGFSFRQSDNRDLKLASLAAASLVCIVLLAIGKAHVGKPPKTYFKTVLSYVIIGFLASGVSYVVGELLKKLFEELGWFDSSSTVATRFPEAKPFSRAWASY